MDMVSFAGRIGLEQGSAQFAGYVGLQHGSVGRRVPSRQLDEHTVTVLGRSVHQEGRAAALPDAFEQILLAVFLRVLPEKVTTAEASVRDLLESHGADAVIRSGCEGEDLSLIHI